MSYPKKPVRSGSSDHKTNTRLSEGRKERLLALQEKESLKGLLIKKFVEKYGKGKSANTDIIAKEVIEFMKTEKLTEENLRRLEDRVKEKTGNGGKNGGNVASGQSQLQRAAEQAIQSRPPENHAENHAPQQYNAPQGLTASAVQQLSNQGGGSRGPRSRKDDDALSVQDSIGPRSVYHLNEDDEWAAIMKYDSELYKKERDLEAMMERERKKKVKMELDQQITEKQRLKEMEQDELSRYMDVQKKLLTIHDVKEKSKEDERKQRNLQEKLSRDKQLQEENLRKKLEKRQEREMDALLVRKIKEELENEQNMNLQKKLNERDRLKRVMVENEDNKRKILDEAAHEKQSDIRAQEEYTRLIEKQEAEREKELQDREARAKKLMSMMADTVIKDQKQMLVEEEKKILKYYLEREEKAMKDEESRKRKLLEQKMEVRKFLDHQMNEKNSRKKQEDEFNKKQADIWKRDTEDFYENEKKKSDYIKEVNKQHAEILKQQMNQPHPGTKKTAFQKMNHEELLLNKGKLKEIAGQQDGFVKEHLH